MRSHRDKNNPFYIALILPLLILLLAPWEISSFAQAGGAQNAEAAKPSADGAALIEAKTFPSKALARDVRYLVHLPPSYNTGNRRYPVIYFLHGLFENERRWQERGAAALLDRLRSEGHVGDFIVAVPDGGRSFYMNFKDGKGQFEDAIAKDFIEYIDANYRTIAAKQGRAIMGISMGGFGALKIAFRYPDKFSGVGAHSAALVAEAPAKPAEQNTRAGRIYYQILTPIFGDPIDKELFDDNNPVVLAERNAAKIKSEKLKIYFDCGTEDRFGFYEGAKILDERLTKAGIEHEFHLFPGNHGWEYGLSVLDRSLGFLWQTLSQADKAKAKAR